MSRLEPNTTSDPAGKRDASAASAQGGRAEGASANPSSFKITLGESIAARRLAEQSGEKKPGEPSKVPSAVSELLKSAAEVMKAAEPKAPPSSASKLADAAKLGDAKAEAGKTEAAKAEAAKAGDPSKSAEDAAGVTIRVTGAKAVRTDSSGRKFEASSGKWDPRGGNKAAAEEAADGADDSASDVVEEGARPARKSGKGLNAPSPVVMAAGRDDDEDEDDEEDVPVPRTWETRAGVAVLFVLLAALGGVAGYRVFTHNPKNFGETVAANGPQAVIGKTSEEPKEKPKPTLLAAGRKDGLFAPRDPNVKAAAYESESAAPADETPPTAPKSVPGAAPSRLPSERTAERMPDGASETGSAFAGGAGKLPFDPSPAAYPPTAPVEVGPPPGKPEGEPSTRIKMGAPAAGSAFSATNPAAPAPPAAGGAFASPFAADAASTAAGASGSAGSPRAATGSSRTPSDKPFMGNLAEMPIGASRRAAPRSPRAAAPGSEGKSGAAEWPTARDAAAWPYPSTRDAAGAAGNAAPKTPGAPRAAEPAAVAAWPPAGPNDPAAGATPRAAQEPASAFPAAPRAAGEAAVGAAAFPGSNRAAGEPPAAAVGGYPASPRAAEAPAGTTPKEEGAFAASPRAPKNEPAAGAFAATPRAGEEKSPRAADAPPASPHATGGAWGDRAAFPTTGPAAADAPRGSDRAASPRAADEPTGTAAFPYAKPGATEPPAGAPSAPWSAGPPTEAAPTAAFPAPTSPTERIPSVRTPSDRAAASERAASERNPTARTPSDRAPSARTPADFAPAAAATPTEKEKPAETAATPRAAPGAFAPAGTPSERIPATPSAAETAATPRAPVGTPTAAEPVPAAAPTSRVPSERIPAAPLATTPIPPVGGAAAPLHGGFREVSGDDAAPPKASAASGFAPARNAAPSARAAEPNKAPQLVEVEVEELVPARPAAAVAGKYVVQPGDNYWTISQQLYGDGSYHRALAAYQASQQGRGLLRVGDAFAAPSAGELRSRYPGLFQAEQAAAAASTEGSVRKYKVRGGETLHDIARSQLGKSSRWVDIYDLNQEQLGAAGGQLPAGLELSLPSDGPDQSASAKQRKTR